MKQVLCMSFVLLIATTASAQFSKGVPKTNETNTADKTERKVADRGRTDRTAKAADQANSDTEMANALLAIMDTDGDGVVSKTEMAKAMAAIRKVHKDSKGNISYEKPADNGNALAGGDTTRGGAGLNDGNGRDNEAMGRLMQYDRNRDGVLSADELPPQARAMLQGADLNGDNVIDARELAAFSARMKEQMRSLGLGNGANGVRGNGVPGDGGGRKPPRGENNENK
jgi:Ca2+-binding EF-hand superfamily protein